MNVCLKCNALVNVKLSVCACGHCFAMKRKAVMKSKRVAMKSLNILESDNDKLVRQRNERIVKLDCVISWCTDKNKIKRKAKQRSLESQH